MQTGWITEVLDPVAARRLADARSTTSTPAGRSTKRSRNGEVIS